MNHPRGNDASALEDLALNNVMRRTMLKSGFGLGLSAFAPKLTWAADSNDDSGLSPGMLTLWAQWQDALVPGAAAAGAAMYLGTQLALPRDHNSLFLRYMDWPGSYHDFYRDGLNALDTLIRARFGRTFPELDKLARATVVNEISAGQPANWSGPPAGLFYFVSKADAADLVFGTVAGIQGLGLDYRAHIEPHAEWPSTRGGLPA